MIKFPEGLWLSRHWYESGAGAVAGGRGKVIKWQALGFQWAGLSEYSLPHETHLLLFQYYYLTLIVVVFYWN